MQTFFQGIKEKIYLIAAIIAIISTIASVIGFPDRYKVLNIQNTDAFKIEMLGSVEILW